MQAFPDNAARREVEALAAVCPNEGCTWAGTIKEFEVHANAKQAGKLTPTPSQISTSHLLGLWSGVCAVVSGHLSHFDRGSTFT